jgi:lysophospholipase L1-like esterase
VAARTGTSRKNHGSERLDEELCRTAHLIYLDYFPAMEDSRHGMKAELSRDGVHPNAAGYAVMQKLAEPAIAKALSQSKP